MKGPAQPISRRKDLLAATPLILWCLFGIWGFVIQIGRGQETLLQMAAQIAGMLYLGLTAVLLILRRPPLLRLIDNGVRLFVLIAANFQLLLLLLPHAKPSPAIAALSACLLLIGTCGSIWALAALGRGFAIFPQARLLATDGPYRFIRHPLYVMESIAGFGLALQFRQPWGLLMAFIALALQFPRMRLEERVMTKAFPDYADYARHTPQFVPFLHRVEF